MAIENIIIIGAGQAATQAAVSLRNYGYTGAIKIFGNESIAPYQRPPLSKAYMMGQMGLENLQFRAPEFWESQNIDLIINCNIVKIDRNQKFIVDDKGNHHSFDKLILATGSRVRKLNIEGADLDNVYYLKTIADSDVLGNAIANAKSLAIIGAGYVGLEVAAVAAKKGLKVTVFEAAPRVLARVACSQLAQFFTDFHANLGVEIITNAQISALKSDGKVNAVLMQNGDEIPADVVLIGIGILPNDELAKEAGVLCENGINSDDNAMTSDENIYACGDCSNRMLEIYGVRMRLESVHNAIEQAKLAAAHIMKQPKLKLETPWFWSDQADVKLQIAGLAIGATKVVLRGDMAAKKFALYHLDDTNRILAVDAINSAPEFLTGKNLIAQKAKIAPEILSDLNISAKELANKIQS